MTLPGLIETHVHTNSKPLQDDLDGVLSRAAAAGVTDLIAVGFDRDSSARAVEQARARPHLWAVVGIHPHDARSWSESIADELRAWSASPRVVAIGEIGLDFYRDLSPRDLQRAAFLDQLALARAADLPVVIHCRPSEGSMDAYDEVLDILEADASDLRVIVHCFGGERRHAERIWARRWWMGVDGPVTYKKSDALRQIVADAPAECLLLETDAPYLSPEPLRGKFPNEPARLPYIAAAVAAARGQAPEALAAQTAANARRAFPRLVSA